MEGEYKIFGKGLTSKEAKKSAEAIEKWREEGKENIEGELEKMPEELKMIEKINDYLSEELEELDIARKIKIAPNQYHIFSEEIFYKKYPRKKNAIGFHDSMVNAIYVKKTNRLQLYKTMLHEAIHVASSHIYFVDVEEKEILQFKVGYGADNPIEKEHEHFRGFNEAIVDMTVKEILLKHKDELVEEFDIKSEEEQKSGVYWQAYADILKIIIKKIAEENGEPEESVWSRFKKGQFTGEMMHLRDIERKFGKGALRVIAALESGVKILPEKKINKKMLRYFETDNEKERDEIAEEILTERERLRYRMRKKRLNLT